MEIRKIRINADLRNHKKGEIIEVEECRTPHKEYIYWKRRLKEAEIDNCCEIYNDTKVKGNQITQKCDTIKEENKKQENRQENRTA